MITKEKLYELYCDQKLTDVEIANKISCNKQTVYLLRKKYGIAKLEKWERHDPTLSERQVQIILGGLLGDASISNGLKSNKRCHSSLEFKQGPKQKKYLYWKYEELKDISSCPPRPVGNDQLRFRSFAHPLFSELRQEWYPNGKKIVPESARRLNSLGLAVWFMDDGQNCNQGLNLALSTCSFDKSDHELLLTILENNFNITGNVRVYGGYNRLYIDNKNRDDFLKQIHPHFPESMLYKLNRKGLDRALSRK